MNDATLQPLLSLCIPTYNRAKFLDESIKLIGNQINQLQNQKEIEFLISDNQSTDNTQDVVKKHIKKGIPITYVCNEKNLGMDGNFVSCFKKASGKYVWLLGDDDFLTEGSLEKIMSILRNKDYGLLHINTYEKHEAFSLQEYSNSESFISDISYWFTFISSNIVRTSYVPTIDFEKYMGTYFTLVPLYMTAALKEKKNAIFNMQTLEIGKNSARNGGYNIFKVFIDNFLGIWKEYMIDTKDFNKNYYILKKNLFEKFLLKYIWDCLIRNNKGNFSSENGWRILLSHYGKYPYFYKDIIQLFTNKLKNKLPRNS